jgi:Protein of unknown function (DUF1592)/Protein of unknown function (DUF1588)/Protein of unknown function (DUF1595)/Protein of unknown function (DUF1587)/Protein of unknown function (DUF1585)
MELPKWPGRRTSLLLSLAGTCCLLSAGCTGMAGGSRSTDPGVPPDGVPPTGTKPEPGAQPGTGPGPAGPAVVPVDPGVVSLRRLNTTEFCNSLRDLIGLTKIKCEELPIDSDAFGFNTIGDILTTSALHVEVYERLISQALDEVLAAPATDARQKALLTCPPLTDPADGCASQIVTALAGRAWRRPPAAGELTQYLDLFRTSVAMGAPALEALGTALRALFLSPNFLFRIELDPPGAGVHALSSYEVATRLSYSLWSTTPDAELLSAAKTGALQDRAEVQKQVARMLKDPRANALVTEFAGQWLGTRDIGAHDVDTRVFKTWDETLRNAMKAETEAFIKALLAENRAIKELFTANFTFVNDRLSKHYMMAPIVGKDLVRVALDGTQRRGLLTQGSILTLTSHPDRTSPVRRGIFVSEQLLCTKIPDPPPGANVFQPVPAGAPPTTMRAQLAKHRENPVCGSCHNIIDPIGLGLETYDGIGLYRSIENGLPVDSTGQLPDGRPFSGPLELAALLSEDARFERCLLDRFMTFALGRAFTAPDDSGWTDGILKETHAGGSSIGGLITAALSSPPALSRKPAPMVQGVGP